MASPWLYRGELVCLYVSADRLTFDQVSRVPDELKAAIVLFYSLLDERQRRLYAGLEAAKIGHGGDSQIAALLGVDPDTTRYSSLASAR